jgi:hypothetical protein
MKCAGECAHDITCVEEFRELVTKAHGTGKCKRVPKMVVYRKEAKQVLIGLVTNTGPYIQEYPRDLPSKNS